jgi:exopolysaccharide biosynthesis polyprenyl glycosylphosphotransferase
MRSPDRGIYVSESMTVAGWRVGGGEPGDLGELAFVEHVGESLPRRGYRRGALVRRVLLAADVAGLVIAFVLANTLLSRVGDSADKVTPGYEYVAFLLAIPLWILLLRLEGLYDRDEERTDHSTVDDIVGVFRSVTVGVWVFVLFGVATGLVQPMLARLGLFWLAAVMLIPALRAVGRVLCRHMPGYTQNALIVGGGNVGQQLALKLMNHREYGIRLVGFVDDRPTDLDEELAARLPVLLGGPERLRELITEHGVQRVIIAFSNDSHESVLANIRAIRDLDVQIDIVPRFFEVFGGGAEVHTLEGIPLVGLRPTRLSRSSRFLKRAFDLSASLLGMLVLFPAFVVIALLIKLESRGPVFFRQVRRGANDSTFRIFKFRTMVAEAEDRKADVVHLNMHRDRDPRMTKIPNDPRVTRIGRFLRRSSIDELPQLINVIKGEMSLVGPRPLILEEDAFVQEWARRRLDIKPGITGLWQVLGRSDIPFDEMTKLDYVYVTNWSLREDIRLILLTIPALLRPRRAF